MASHHGTAGFATGLAAGLALALGRKALTVARNGRGHPPSYRVLDVASGLMQPKYPLDAMSTYLNGFHMYADDMGRQAHSTDLLASTAGRRHSLSDISVPDVDPRANPWESVRSVQTRVDEVGVRRP